MAVLRAMGITLKSMTEGNFNCAGAAYRPKPWAPKLDLEGQPSLLQQSTTLGSSADWQSPGTAPVRDGNFVVLTVNGPLGNAFYRLRK